MDSVLIWSYSLIILLQLLSLYASFIIYLLSFVQFVPDLRDERLKVNEARLRLGVLLPGGEGRTQKLNKCLYVEAAARGPTPYPFIYHFSRKK